MTGSLSREDLIDLVRRVVDCKGTDAEIDGWIATIRGNLADPKITDYIFWPDRPMTPEEIVDRALAYESIQLPPAAGSP